VNHPIFRYGGGGSGGGSGGSHGQSETKGYNLLEPSIQSLFSHLYAHRLHSPLAWTRGCFLPPCTPLFPPTSPPPPPPTPPSSPPTTKPPPSKPLSLPRRLRSLFRCSVISFRGVYSQPIESDRPTMA